MKTVFLIYARWSNEICGSGSRYLAICSTYKEARDKLFEFIATENLELTSETKVKNKYQNFTCWEVCDCCDYDEIYIEEVELGKLL